MVQIFYQAIVPDTKINILLTFCVPNQTIHAFCLPYLWSFVAAKTPKPLWSSCTFGTKDPNRVYCDRIRKNLRAFPVYLESIPSIPWEHSQYTFTFCMLRNFSCFMLPAEFFQKIILGIPTECQRVWIQIMQAGHFVRPDLGPNCVRK